MEGEGGGGNLSGPIGLKKQSWSRILVFWNFGATNVTN